jgi:hypothetical protein
MARNEKLRNVVFCVFYKYLCNKKFNTRYLVITRIRAIAQAISRWLPNSASRVRAKVRTCGVCGGQSNTGAGFLRVFRPPLQILIQPTPILSSASNIRGWYNRPIGGRRAKWTQSHLTPRN